MLACYDLVAMPTSVFLLDGVDACEHIIHCIAHESAEGPKSRNCAHDQSLTKCKGGGQELFENHIKALYSNRRRRKIFNTCKGFQKYYPPIAEASLCLKNHKESLKNFPPLRWLINKFISNISAFGFHK